MNSAICASDVTVHCRCCTYTFNGVPLKGSGAGQNQATGQSIGRRTKTRQASPGNKTQRERKETGSYLQVHKLISNLT
ncbi:MAG TPA: hypothetical protein DGH25_10105 [Erwiniaceae bacterium]|nr:hypothetical protein [Erwiniaceae bacterium]